MKNRIHLVLVVVAAVSLLVSCRLRILSVEEDKKLKEWRAPTVILKRITNHDWAKGCIKEYEQYMTSHFLKRDDQSTEEENGRPKYITKTTEVIFNKLNLINWLSGLKTTKFIAVKFGKFQNEDEADQNGYIKGNENSRHLTVFLWPYSDRCTEALKFTSNILEEPYAHFEVKNTYEGSDFVIPANQRQWAWNCINRYESFFYKNFKPDDDSNKELDGAQQPKYTTKTTEVLFEKQPLIDWLNSLETANYIHFKFGRYQNEKTGDQDGYFNNSDSRRMTVFLWPYKNGQPAKEPTSKKVNPDGLVDPYNLGEIHP